MLNRCARCILCKREALPEAMQSVARVGLVRRGLELQRLASVLRL